MVDEAVHLMEDRKQKQKEEARIPVLSSYTRYPTLFYCTPPLQGSRDSQQCCGPVDKLLANESLCNISDQNYNEIHPLCIWNCKLMTPLGHRQIFVP